MDELINQEKEKYTNAWQVGAEGQSRTEEHIIKYLLNLDKNYKILELGCGNGYGVNYLRTNGFNVYGMDITSQVFNGSPYLVQGCLWDLPFKDNEFDFVFSVDVLEHLPPNQVELAIKEIIRITKIKTLHCIATFKDNRKGFIFHLTVQPIEWWKEKFNELNQKNVELEIIDRTQFLKTVIPNYLGK